MAINFLNLQEQLTEINQKIDAVVVFTESSELVLFQLQNNDKFISEIDKSNQSLKKLKIKNKQLFNSQKILELFISTTNQILLVLTLLVIKKIYSNGILILFFILNATCFIVLLFINIDKDKLNEFLISFLSNAFGLLATSIREEKAQKIFESLFIGILCISFFQLYFKVLGICYKQKYFFKSIFCNESYFYSDEFNVTLLTASYLIYSKINTDQPSEENRDIIVFIVIAYAIWRVMMIIQFCLKWKQKSKIINTIKKMICIMVITIIILIILWFYYLDEKISIPIAILTIIFYNIQPTIYSIYYEKQQQTLLYTEIKFEKKFFGLIFDYFLGFGIASSQVQCYYSENLSIFVIIYLIIMINFILLQLLILQKARSLDKGNYYGLLHQIQLIFYYKNNNKYFKILKAILVIIIFLLAMFIFLKNLITINLLITIIVYACLYYQNLFQQEYDKNLKNFNKKKLKPLCEQAKNQQQNTIFEGFFIDFKENKNQIYEKYQIYSTYKNIITNQQIHPEINLIGKQSYENKSINQFNTKNQVDQYYKNDGFEIFKNYAECKSLKIVYIQNDQIPFVRAIYNDNDLLYRNLVISTAMEKILAKIQTILFQELEDKGMLLFQILTWEIVDHEHLEYVYTYFQKKKDPHQQALIDLKPVILTEFLIQFLRDMVEKVKDTQNEDDNDEKTSLKTNFQQQMQQEIISDQDIQSIKYYFSKYQQYDIEERNQQIVLYKNSNDIVEGKVLWSPQQKLNQNQIIIENIPPQKQIGYDRIERFYNNDDNKMNLTQEQFFYKNHLLYTLDSNKNSHYSFLNTKNRKIEVNYITFNSIFELICIKIYWLEQKCNVLTQLYNNKWDLSFDEKQKISSFSIEFKLNFIYGLDSNEDFQEGFIVPKEDLKEFANFDFQSKAKLNQNQNSIDVIIEGRGIKKLISYDIYGRKKEIQLFKQNYFFYQLYEKQTFSYQDNLINEHQQINYQGIDLEGQQEIIKFSYEIKEIITKSIINDKIQIVHQFYKNKNYNKMISQEQYDFLYEIIIINDKEVEIIQDKDNSNKDQNIMIKKTN